MELNNMKMLFCHDGPLYKNSEGLYYSVGFNDKMFDPHNYVVIVSRKNLRDFCFTECYGN